MLFAFVLSIVRRRDVADDISQDVAMVAFRKAGEFSAGTDFGAWLREIARRTILRERARSARLVVGLDSEAIEALSAAHGRIGTDTGFWEEREAALLRCIRKLRDRSRRILELRCRGDADIASIARELKSTVNSVKVTLSGIRRVLRKCVRAELAPGAGAR
jgi:RNA polymerase sigma-70 factor (ECF subfamily)